MNQLLSLKIQHCFSEANTCTDALIKEAINFQDVCILDSPSVEMSHLLLHDISGLYCNCICNDYNSCGCSVVFVSIIPYYLKKNKKKNKKERKKEYEKIALGK